jgi:hypothetical protein
VIHRFKRAVGRPLVTTTPCGYGSRRRPGRQRRLLQNTPSPSRGADRPRLALVSPSSKTEGAGKAGRRLHPRSCTKSARVDHRFNRIIRLSPRNGLRLIRALPGVTRSVAPVASGLTMHKTRLGQNASPKTWRQPGAPERHDFTVRAYLRHVLTGPRAIRQASTKTVSSAVRPHAGRSLTAKPPCDSLRARRCRVHRISTRVRDDSRSAPSSGETGRISKGDLPDGAREIFFAKGLDTDMNGPKTDLPVGHPACLRQS